ncbi:hypothetical protein L2E82_38126 [Cichorium intybus]|uniref:Uncharacterized protein n=1 Tax=Cichorium intybus TaxID=13427 RepID=A0ACB9AFB7_CICIN|nr:hypothetical protein L2E82_38126 [Cichorium intybus]
MSRAHASFASPPSNAPASSIAAVVVILTDFSPNFDEGNRALFLYFRFMYFESQPSSGTTSDFWFKGADGGGGNNNRDSPYQSYDLQQAARLIEHVLPFSLLLLVVFIRQHFQDFLVTIWIAAFMFKSNDVLRKQTALKGQMFTMVEYLLLLYRALLPAPVWYRFCSCVVSILFEQRIWKPIFVQSLISSIKALSRKEIHYGPYATSEQASLIFLNLFFH